MNPAKGRPRVYIAFGAICALYVLSFASEAVFIAMGDEFRLGDAIFTAMTFTYPLVGFLICRDQPRNTVGWVLLGIGLGWIFAAPLDAYGHYALVVRPGSLPGGTVAVVLSSWSWVPPVGLMGTFLLLLFPNGRLLSPRWRIVGWLSAIAMVHASLSIIFGPRVLEEEGFPGLANPLHIRALAGLFEALIIFVPLIAVCIVASAVSLVQRFRRSRGVERLQMKWLTTAAAFLAVVFVIAMGGSLGSAWGMPNTPGWVSFFQNAATVGFFLIPISIGIAILRHRLFDLDIVINKALVYGALAAFITAIYVGIVVGIGALIGSGDEPNLGLSLAATAVVAIAFQPVRSRVQRLANRLVYGARLSPYEAVTEFSNRISTSLSFEEVLPRMAEAAAKGVGGTRASVTMFLPGGSTEAAYFPEEEESNSFDKTVKVTHQGETVGEIAVVKAPGEQINEGEDKLLKDLASQAGLAMRNLRLTAELRQRLIELQESRKRIVEAQDQERRRMERDIHDGAQQQLVSLSVKLSLAKTLATKDQAKASEMLDQIKAETEQVVESVRDLARGIFPPLLAERGLGDALKSHAQKAAPNTRVEDNTQGSRFAPEVESAVYFTIREALQNASKHAPNQPITVTLSTAGDHMRFQVNDQGPGFDMGRTKQGLGLGNMRDRIEAIGGEFRIKSSPGQGTTVEGRILLKVMEPVG